MSKPPLLTTAEMASFADNGFLRFDALVPEQLCRGLMADLQGRVYADTSVARTFQTPLSGHFGGTALGEILALPALTGIIQSLVGVDCLYDHHVAHVLPKHSYKPNSGSGSLHQDFPIDLRPYTFDINLSIYPHEVTPGMAGTMLIPGSHFRRTLNNDLYRYQHIRGAKRIVCPAGTVVAWHGKLWHAGQPNHSDRDRIMFKLRLNPTAPQVALWDTSDLDTYDPTPVFRFGHPWMGSDHLVEFMHRIRFWRYLTGKHDFDIEGFWTRVSNSFADDHDDPRYRIPTLDALKRFSAQPVLS